MQVTKKQMVADWVKKSIRSGVIQPGDKIPSESEITERFGVSRGSVRQSIQILVTEGILESRQGIGTFVCNAPRSESSTLAFVCYRNYSYIFPEMIHGFNSVLQRNRRRMILGETRYGLDLERKILLDLIENGVSGIAITPVEGDQGQNNLELFEKIENRGIPIVLLDNDLGCDQLDSVVQDDFLGGRQAGDTLINQGHRRIGIVYSTNYHPKLQRMKGVKNALNSVGLELESRHIVGIKGQSSARRAYLQIRNYVYNSKNLPTAFVCSSDDEALMLMRNLKRRGMKIPEDVSIISFDNSEISRLSRPTLTTMDHPSMHMGELAANVLIGRLAISGFRTHTRIVVEPNLISRKSITGISVE
ncbi:substrate-binding domain-containing protein [Oceanispirochaeta sp.]|uniref:substrate-binding domain-containing protein n=1 Tax=Oceanispirochaeta sp. TaxID=2035350 RepID=UPI0026356BB1|nr:substrate-binding domain-containing protein [Oceanispirochaeta sp.]